MMDPEIDPENEFAFLDHVVESFASTVRQLIGEAQSGKDLETICYGVVLAACILHCQKHGIDDGQREVLQLVRQIFDERREREAKLPVPTDVTLH